MKINDSPSARIASIRTEVRTGRRFENGLVRHRHSYKLLIAAFLRDLGPSIAEHLAEVSGIPYPTVAGRMAEMKREGIIEFCGKRYTSRHRLAAMYRLVGLRAR